MEHARPLSADFAARYRAWQEGDYQAHAGARRKLAEEGQHPKALVIGCSDSRVNALAMFDAAPGEIFVHRNVANLVPPSSAGAVHVGTSAVVEYAVTALKVPSIIIMGHSRCGGVAGCRAMCEGEAPTLADPASSIGRWVDHLRPAYDTISETPAGERDGALERAGVLMSLANLMTFPYVASAVAAGALSLHGLWTDIGSGALEVYDPAADGFVAL